MTNHHLLMIVSVSGKREPPLTALLDAERSVPSYPFGQAGSFFGVVELANCKNQLLIRHRLGKHLIIKAVMNLRRWGGVLCAE
jgi:hypothetical protein